MYIVIVEQNIRKLFKIYKYNTKNEFVYENIYKEFYMTEYNNILETKFRYEKILDSLLVLQKDEKNKDILKVIYNILNNLSFAYFEKLLFLIDLAITEEEKSYLYDNIMEYRKENYRTAYTTEKKECHRCGLCCYAMPCEYNIEDIKRISSYFNLNEKDFFKKYLTVNYYDRHTYTIVSVRKEQQDLTGKFKPNIRMYDVKTPCVFLSSDSLIKKCKINKVKPKSAVKCNCWTEQPFQEIAETFTKKELEDYLDTINLKIKKGD